MATGARVGGWGQKPRRQSRPPSRLDRNKSREPEDRDPPSLDDFPKLKWNQPNKQWLQRWKPFGDKGPTFVASPNEAVDPRDCDRFPNSVYCGNFPFSWPPEEPRIDFEFHFGPCETIVQMDFSLLGFKGFPTFHAGVRVCEQPPPPPPPPDPPPEPYSGWQWKAMPGGGDPCLYLLQATQSGTRRQRRPYPFESQYEEVPFVYSPPPHWVYGPLYGRYQYLALGNEAIASVGVVGVRCHWEVLSGSGTGRYESPRDYNLINGEIGGIVAGTQQSSVVILDKVCPPDLPRRKRPPDPRLPAPKPRKPKPPKRRRPPKVNCCKEVLEKLNRLLKTEKATITTVTCSLNDQGVWAFQRATTQIDVPRSMKAAIEFKSERLAQAAELECLGRNGGSGTVSAFVPRVSCVYVQPEDGDPYWDPQTSQFEVQVPADMRDSIIVTAQEVAKGTAELCRQRNNTAPTSADCVAIMPSESYGFVKQSILKLRFCKVDEFPRSSNRNSVWDLEIPNPIDGLDWCEHLESFRYTKGYYYARCIWSDSNHRSGAYTLNESEGEKLNNFIDSLSKNTPKRKVISTEKCDESPDEPVELRIARAYLIPFENGQRLNTVCFVPPVDGC